MEHALFDTEAMIAEVAKRHKILLAPDDPAFALVTLNEIVLSRFLELVEARLDDLESRLSQISARQTEAAKAIGENIITASAAYVAERLKDANASLTTLDVYPRNEKLPVSFCDRLNRLASVIGAFASGLAVSALLH